jgi:hypothetical protein
MTQHAPGCFTELEKCRDRGKDPPHKFHKGKLSTMLYITKPPRSLLSIMFSFLLGFVFISAVFWPMNASALLGLMEGDSPKKFVLKNLDGESVDITRFVGSKPVVIVFWKIMEQTTFLDYSLDELLFLEDLYVQYHDEKELQIFGIYTPKQDKEIPEDEIARVGERVHKNE